MHTINGTYASMQKINSTDKVLAELMRIAGVNQAELNRRTGVKQSTISRILNPSGRYGIKTPTDQQLRPLAEFFKCSVDQLRGYLPLDESQLKYELKEKSLSVYKPEPKYEMIPLLQCAGECGNGHMNEHEEVEGELAFRRDWLKKMGIKAADLRVIYATGDSMYPSILDGDVLLVNVADVEPSSGKIYALRRPDGSIIIKRLNQRMTGGWVISSDNPDKRAYPDEACDESTLHTLSVAGRVVWRGGSGF